MPLTSAPDSEITVGVIADTHGRLSPQAIQALQGVSLIIHAGDLDTEDVFRQLSQIAPVRAVRGNMDTRVRSLQLPSTVIIRVEVVEVYVLHNLANLDLDPAVSGFKAVIYGHTHVPEITRRGAVLYFNPGSPALPRRGSRPSVGRMLVQGAEIQAELLYLG